MRVAVIGDLMLDVLVEPLGPLHPGDDTRGEIRLECGGQAANVAAWVVALGGRARLVCARTADAGGARAADGLAARGVEVVGPVVPEGGGVVVSIIAPSGERTLVSDPGCTRALRPEHLDDEWFADCAWLHVSGYHLLDDDAVEAAVCAAELTRSLGGRVSLDLAYAARLRELGAAEVLRRVGRVGPDLVFLTVEEAEALGEPIGAPVSVVKQGPGGCAVVSGDGRFERFERPAVEASVVDTTGAGDAFAAGFLVAGGDDPLAGADGGLAAAAMCVAAVGAMPGGGPAMPRGAVPIQVDSR